MHLQAQVQIKMRKMKNTRKMSNTQWLNSQSKHEFIWRRPLHRHPLTPRNSLKLNNKVMTGLWSNLEGQCDHKLLKYHYQVKLRVVQQQGRETTPTHRGRSLWEIKIWKNIQKASDTPIKIRNYHQTSQSEY